MKTLFLIIFKNIFWVKIWYMTVKGLREIFQIIIIFHDRFHFEENSGLKEIRKGFRRNAKLRSASQYSSFIFLHKFFLTAWMGESLNQ